MHDCRPVHGLPGRLQAAGPAGGDERPAPGESLLSSSAVRIGSGFRSSRLTVVICSTESGEREGNVSTQEQHRKGAFLSEAEISESHVRHKRIVDRKFTSYTRLRLRCLPFDLRLNWST